ncbi:MAG: redox-sensing transcriptional repressor Rex [Bacillota bacterium]|nr:redox-sensing transcriptional repressor Rex [Bacillota bacterium]
MDTIPKQTLMRLPNYYNFIKGLQNSGIRNISSPAIAKELNLNEVQVRKDLAAVSQIGGKPKMGFDIGELLNSLEHCLGYDNVNDAVLVGAGQLGRALLTYKGFETYGMRIIAAFDTDEGIIGTEISGKRVFPADSLFDLCPRLKVHIGIITVQDSCAQGVCDKLVKSGILAVWNFAPVHLTVPDHILVRNENMAVSLAVLSKHLKEKMISGDVPEGEV